MTSQALAAALDEPDNVASHSRLYDLIAARSFSGRTLPSIAERYLRAFTDVTSSSTRRRWVGIALAGMLDVSLDVVRHLKQLPQGLQELGAIVLSNTELEETKIVAGIIIRQSLEQGIDYCDFWASNKVRDSAPRFPENSGPRWMAEFQSFLDTLGDLALLSGPDSDPSLIYPISLVASDGFKWRESNDGLPISIIQAGMLTVIAPDGLLRQIQFIGVPISHIHKMRCQRSVLHDSQARTIGHEPWDLILELRAEPWSYVLDTSRRTGFELTLLFHHSADAKEWERCIKEHQNEQKNLAIDVHPAAHPSMSSSSPIDLRRSPLQIQTGQKDDAVKPALDQNKMKPVQRPNASISKDISDGATLPDQTESIDPSQHGVIRSKGKLPRVSQQAKLKASKQLNPQPDVFELPDEDPKRTKGQKKAGLEDASNSKLASQKQPQRSKVAVHKPSSSAKRTQFRTKRKADDGDGDFVLEEERSRTKTNAGRTSAARKRRKKEIRTDSGEDGTDLTEAKKQHTDTKTSMRPIPANSRVATKVSKPRKLKPKSVDIPSSSVSSSRYSLIGGLLLGSQQQSRVSPKAFKKPELPAHTSVTTQPKIQPTSPKIRPQMRPQTPTTTRKRLNDESLPPMPSPPPLGYAISGRSDRMQRITTNAEVLSSNSKPLPASPNAESTAISGHADRDEVDIEKLKGDIQMATSDPFRRGRECQKLTSFTRRLTGESSTNEVDLGESPTHRKSTDLVSIDTSDAPANALVTAASQPLAKSPESIHILESQPSQSPERENSTMDDDITLVNHDEDQQTITIPKASPIYFHSSPPIPGSPSSHSSTSAEPELTSQPPPLPTSQAEEMEWEASLQPHQRAIHDLLIRTSKRVLRHIVDSETAVTDIADIFARDGAHILTTLQQRHDSDYHHVFQDMAVKMEGLKRELERAAKDLLTERRRVSAI
ncbi:hypothetical protein N0V83_005059 [Neocucurbitaria cava]|uniref:Uncharacterized protein n=1 Tax=Neocucurbitaria cava TaxID=798079 RepID=A0A9W8YB62_9PLEO|nr:hypothetical protein N0V83_005059 [Neocucurbitaria cava]